jgi:hypothetical protein
MRGLGLVHETEVRRSANPHAPHRHELLHEAERPVVHRAAAHQAVVAVEVALAETNGYPTENEWKVFFKKNTQQ